MKGANKLLLDVSGQPMIRKVVETVIASKIDPVLAITGFERERIEASLEGLSVSFEFNDQFEEGMGSSIAKGIRSLDTSDLDGVLLCLGDLPKLSRKLVEAVLVAFADGEGKRIVVPVFRGRRGHPVIFPARFKEELERLDGDVGARQLLQRERDSLIELEVEDEGAVYDWDS